MIDLFTWPTPNAYKIHIMLEECNLEYAVHAVNIREGEQFEKDFLKISPNNRIPAIIDSAGTDGQRCSMFESGAILIYLAEKTGKFLAAKGEARHEALQWLMFQMGGVGPMFGQFAHFTQYAPEKMEYSITRYASETARLFRVLETRLTDVPYLAGDMYSIADIATYPWCRNPQLRGQDLATLPNVKRWIEQIDKRSAVQRGLNGLSDYQSIIDTKFDAKANENMHGSKQFEDHRGK